MGAMTSNTSPPDSFEACVDEQGSDRGHGTSSDCVREPIRRDQDRLRLRTLLLAGASSAPTAPVDEAYFASLREHVLCAGDLGDGR